MILYLKTDFVGMEVKATRDFLLWSGVKVFKLSHAESKKVGQWHGGSEQQSDPFTVVLDGIRIEPILALIMAAAQKQYNPSNNSDSAALELIV